MLKKILCALLSVLMVVSLLPMGVFADSYELVTEVAITSFSSGNYLLDVIDDVRAALSGGGYMEIDAEADSTGGAWFQAGVSDSTWAWGSTASSVTWINAGDSQTVTVTSSDFAAVADFDDAWTAIYVQGGSTLNVTAIRVYGVVEEDPGEEEDPSEVIHTYTVAENFAYTITDYITDYSEGDTLVISATLESDGYFIGTVGAAVADGWTSIDGGFESSDGSAITAELTITVGTDTYGEVQVWWMGGTYVNLTSLTITKDSGSSSGDDEEDPGEEDETTYYTITLTEVDYATVTADKTTAAEGEEVTITVDLEDGYGFNGLSILYWVSENHAYGLGYTDNGDGSYTFTMPAYDVEVYVSVGSLSITSEYTEGGYVACSGSYANAGDTVWAYVFVYYGYEISGNATVVDGEGNTIELTEVDTQTYNSDVGPVTYYVYTFTMPESSVTVSATFSEDEDAPEIGIVVYNYAVNDFTYFYDVDWTDSNTYLEITYQLNYESDDDVDNYADWQSGAINAIGDDYSWIQLYWLPSYGESNGTYAISLADLAAIVEEAGYNIDNGVLIDWWVGADDYSTLLDVQLVTYEPSTEEVLAANQELIATLSELLDTDEVMYIDQLGSNDDYGWYDYSLAIYYGEVHPNWDEIVASWISSLGDEASVGVGCLSDSYVAPIAGTEDDPDGTNGSLTMYYGASVGSEEDGTYVESEFYFVDVVIVATPYCTHDSLKKVGAKAATCDSAGNTEYWYCTDCGRYFSDGNGVNEISEADTVVPATGHTAGTAVIENYVKVTADEDGSYDLVTYCATCGEEISRSHTVIAAYGSGSAEIIDWATVLASANSSNSTTTTTVEDVVIEEPIEPTDTETEDDGEDVASEPAVEAEAETPAETNPTTGVAISLIPMAIAALAAVSSKRK